MHFSVSPLELHDWPLNDPVGALKDTVPVGAASLEPAPVKVAVIVTGAVEACATFTGFGVTLTIGASATIVKLSVCRLLAAL